VTNDNRILKLDPNKKFKTMLRVNLLSDLSKISISPGGNQVVVLHLNNAAGNDLVLSLTTSEDKIGELVGRIASRMTKVCLEMDYHCKP